MNAAPRVPEAATALLGTDADRLVPYARMLAGAGVEQGLIGPREPARLWERHLLNCAAVAGAIPPGADVIDVGSGAGLPGLVWAVLRPDLQITLVEPLLRRAKFLERAIQDLDLPTVQVRRARAEDVVGQISADLVTARAVAPLHRLVTWCLPLVRPGGSFWALKGESAARELAQADPQLQRAGALSGIVAAYGEGVLDPPTRVVQVRTGTVARGGL